MHLTLHPSLPFPSLRGSYPARIVPFDLRAHGGQLVACNGAFLAGPLDTSIKVAMPGSLLTAVFGGAGLLLQRISADDVVFLNAGGTVARRELREGEMLRVNPGCLLAFSSSAVGPDAPPDERERANMAMFTMERVTGISNMLLGQQSLFVGAIRGPGTVWLQSLPWLRVERALLSKTRGVSFGNTDSTSSGSSSSSSSSSS